MSRYQKAKRAPADAYSTVYGIENAAGDILYVGRTSREAVSQRWDEQRRLAARLSGFTRKELILAAYYGELRFTVLHQDLTHRDSLEIEHALILQWRPPGNQMSLISRRRRSRSH